ncbi:hypothetical protein EK904_004405 [Melospiza melodia maxima]|nr:hypothetical protein EK904_004405 [Melospiza melodia maxima]
MEGVVLHSVYSSSKAGLLHTHARQIGPRGDDGYCRPVGLETRRGIGMGLNLMELSPHTPAEAFPPGCICCLQEGGGGLLTHLGLLFLHPERDKNGAGESPQLSAPTYQSPSATCACLQFHAEMEFVRLAQCLNGSSIIPTWLAVLVVRESQI